MNELHASLMILIVSGGEDAEEETAGGGGDEEQTLQTEEETAGAAAADSSDLPADTDQGETTEPHTFSDLPEDDKLFQCFLYALRKKIKLTQLPMLTSGFYRDCLQVCV